MADADHTAPRSPKKAPDGARIAARASGQTFYFTGIPCIRGHVCNRRASNGSCIECRASEGARQSADQREHRSAKNLAWRRANPEQGREYSRAYRRANPEKHAEATLEWKRKNPERTRAIKERTTAKNRASWQAARREKYKADPLERAKVAAQVARYKQNNPHRIRIIRNKQNRGMKQATPKWLSREQRQALAAFYWLAQDCTTITGERYQVDHIIPLRGKGVCGLHVPWNLQVLPREVNQRKSARY